MTLDHEAIRARHNEVKVPEWSHLKNNQCGRCYQTWPCDAIQLLDEVEQLDHMIEEYIAMRREEQEEITSLSEALEKIDECCSPFDLDPLQRALNAVEHCQQLASAALAPAEKEKS